MKDIFKTPEESIFYNDEKLYAALAYESLATGHTVVIWKENVPDLSRMKEDDYDHLMEKVDLIRDKLKKFYGVDKIYLLYMDEAKHVHWHLIPRYDKNGFNNLCHEPTIITDFSDVSKLKEIFKTN